MTAPPLPPCLDVECPHCGAPVGERCCPEWYYLRPRFTTRKPHAVRVRESRRVVQVAAVAVAWAETLP